MRFNKAIAGRLATMARITSTSVGDLLVWLQWDRDTGYEPVALAE